jgi:hypothetical protein
VSRALRKHDAQRRKPSACTQQRQRAVGWNLLHRLRGVEVVGELGSLLLPCLERRYESPLAVFHTSVRSPPTTPRPRRTGLHQSPPSDLRAQAANGRRPPFRVHECRCATSGVWAGLFQSAAASGSNPASRAICPRVRRFGCRRGRDLRGAPSCQPLESAPRAQASACLCSLTLFRIVAMSSSSSRR